MVASPEIEKASANTPANVPRYTVPDVARCLHLPPGQVAHLLGSRFYAEWFEIPFPWEWPLFPATEDDDWPPTINFTTLAGLFVSTFSLLSRSEFIWLADQPEEREPALANAVRHSADWQWSGATPPSRSDIYSEIMARLPKFVSPGADPQTLAWLQKLVDRRFQRIDFEGTTPRRLYPITREPGDSSLRLVVMDPAVRFGQPSLAGRGLATEILYERHQAGESVAELASDYDIPELEVEEAIRFESMPLFGRWPVG